MAKNDKCSKCGLHPRMDPDGTNPWCKECQRIATNIYHQRLLLRAESAGYTYGIKAFRAAVMGLFAHWPTAHFSGAEVIAKVQQLNVPPEEVRQAGEYDVPPGTVAGK